MRVGVIIPGGGMPLSAIVDVAREAEAAGLHGVWVTEAWRSAFVPLTAIVQPVLNLHRAVRRVGR